MPKHSSTVDSFNVINIGSETDVVQLNPHIGIGTNNPSVSVEINTTDSIKIPKGNTNERPPDSTDFDKGFVRYNTELEQFEGFGAGNRWRSLEGVIDTDQDTYIIAESNVEDNDELQFYTTGDQRMIIKDDGKIGIGTDSPTHKLEVEGDIKLTGNLYKNNVLFSTDDLIEGSSNLYYTEERVDSNIATKNTDNLTEGTANLYYTEQRVNTNILNKNIYSYNSNIGVGIEPTEKLDIDGNVLIRSNLKVKGDIFIDGVFSNIQTHIAVTDQLRIVNEGTGPAVIVHQTGIQDIAHFMDDDQFALVIKNAGNVGIGTDTPSHKLQVEGDIKLTGNLYKNNELFTTDDLTEGSVNLYYSDDNVKKLLNNGITGGIISENDIICKGNFKKLLTEEPEVITNNLIAWYKFYGDDVADSSGNGNDLESVSLDGTLQTDFIYPSLKIPENNKYLFPLSITETLMTQNWSISFYVKIDSTNASSTSTMLFGIRTATTEPYDDIYMIAYANSSGYPKVGFNIWNDRTQETTSEFNYYTQDGSVFVYDTWYYITLTMNKTDTDTTVNFYNNGTLIDSQTKTTNFTLPYLDATMQMALHDMARDNIVANNDDKIIYYADFRIYDKALSATEISNLYNHHSLVSVIPLPTFLIDFEPHTTQSTWTNYINSLQTNGFVQSYDLNYILNPGYTNAVFKSTVAIGYIDFIIPSDYDSCDITYGREGSDDPAQLKINDIDVDSTNDNSKTYKATNLVSGQIIRIYENHGQINRKIKLFYFNTTPQYKNITFTHDGSTDNQTEYTVNFPEDTTCDILLIAGGGSGGSDRAGGAGAGSCIVYKDYVMNGNYKIKVGKSGNTNQIIAYNFVPGTTYKLRIWSTSAVIEDIHFTICIGTITPPIIVNSTQYTVPQLVNEVLINSACSTIANITWATGTTVATNGIGYFNKGNSNFPFDQGIILSTGKAAAAAGPNTNILSDGGAGTGTGGDADLSAILAAQTPPANGTLNNSTKLEFDFIAIDPSIQFNFMFASEEYGTFQCGFSDAFAFILTDVTAGTPATNLAVIPGTSTPVSVFNIRDNQYNGGCASNNANLFGNYYANPAGVLGAPINFNGITVPLVASSPVIPGNTYHIKMVIADYNDTAYDSAVFLEGGSFDIGNIALPDDYLIADGTALCLGEDVILDSQLDGTLYDIQWLNGTTIIPGATDPILVVSESGTYFIQAAYLNTDCVTTDSIVVEYFIDTVAEDPEDLVLCDATGQGIFDLTSTRDEILAVFPPNSHEVVYYLTEDDAQNNIVANALTETEAETFLGINGQEIWVRVNFLTTSCFQVVSFNLIVEDLTPQFTLTGDTELCPDETTTITVVPTDNNFDVNTVTYEWTFNTAVIATATTSTLDIVGQSGIGTYTVTVNNSGCSITQTFEVIPSTIVWDITFEGTPTLCPNETGTLTATVNNNTDNLPVSYTFTLPNASVVVSSNNVLPISQVGIYTVEVDILGCTTTQTFEVMPSTVVWDVTFGGTTQLCPSEPGTLTATVNNNADNLPVSYTFTLPNGSQVVSTNNVLAISQTGIYTVVADILGCTSAPVNFTVSPTSANWQVSFVGEPYQICAGESVELAFTASNFDINNPNAVYTWTSPSGTTGTGKTFTANQVGTYTLSVNIFGCISTFNVDVTVNDLAIEIDFTQGCQNNLYRLVAEPFNASFDVATSTFAWTGPNVIATDEPNVIVLGANGLYEVTVTNAQGCSASQSVTVNNTSCTIQRGISPNNDGENDFFDLSALNVKELFIYNRYGTEVYKFGSYTNQWKGQSTGGMELPDGTYFYIIQTQEGENISGWIFINR